MSATISRAAIRIDIEGAREVERDLKRIGETGSRSLAQLVRSAETASSALRLLAPIIGAFSIGALTRMAISSLDAAGGLGELADQTGVSTRALQVLQFAAVQSGISVEELQRALANLTRTISDAAAGDRASIEKFERLGIAFRTASGAARNTEAVFADLAEIISNISNPAERAAVVTTFLSDRFAQRLIPILSLGRRGLEETAAEAQRMGAVLGDDLIAKADDASDALRRLNFAFTAIRNNIVANFAPAISEAISWLNRLIFGPSDMQRLAEIAERIGELEQAIIQAERQMEGALPGGARSVIRSRLERMRREQEELFEEARRIEQRIEERRRQSERGSGVFGQRDIVGAGEADLRRQRAEREMEALRATLDRRVAIERQYQQQLRAIREAAEAGALSEVERARLEAQALSARNEQLRQLARSGARDNEVVRTQERLINEMLRERNRILEQNRTPEEQYIERLERLKSVIATFQGTEFELSAEVIAREIEAASSELARALSRLDDTVERVADAAREMEKAFTSAFESAILYGKDLQDVLRALLIDIARLFLRQFFLQTGVGGIFNWLAKTIFSEKGNVFANGRVIPFASGGVVSRPIAFPLAGNAVGVAGEAGPEAIMPLARDSRGRLGVRATGSGAVVNQTINVTYNGALGGGGSPAANQYEQSRLAREIARLAQAGVLEALREQKRVGGLLSPTLEVA